MSIYKYVPPERLDILASGRVRFTPPRDFNDPFELRPYYTGLASRERLVAELDARHPTIIEETVRAFPPADREKVLAQVKHMMTTERENLVEEFQTMSQSEAKELGERLYSYFNRKLGIFSLSTIPHDILMWSHYTDGHRGFVLEFDEGHSFFNSEHIANPLFQRPLRVAYAEVRPQLVSEEFDQVKVFLVKSKRWEYENEVRILRPLEEATEVRVVGGVTAIHLFELPEDCLVSIVCGCRMRKETYDALLSLVRSGPRYQNVKLRKAILDSAAYSIQFVDVDI